jgi:hypothetical protein
MYGLHDALKLIFDFAVVRKGAPTITPTIHFYHRSIPNAAHSVFSFGVTIPELDLAIHFYYGPITKNGILLAITAFTPYLVLPPCPPSSIFITDQYRMQHIQFLILGPKSPLPPDLTCLLVQCRLLPLRICGTLSKNWKEAGGRSLRVGRRMRG